MILIGVVLVVLVQTDALVDVVPPVLFVVLVFGVQVPLTFAQSGGDIVVLVVCAFFAVTYVQVPVFELTVPTPVLVAFALAVA